MSDELIIKIYEEMFNFKKEDLTELDKAILKDALNLIKRQKAEIEELQLKIDAFENEIHTMMPQKEKDGTEE